MNPTPPHTQLISDYISEENWNAFIGLLPESDRLQAPSYTEGVVNIKKQEESFLKMGVAFKRIEVDVPGWQSWVAEQGKAFTRESAGQYAMHKFVKQSTGLEVRAVLRPTQN